jgi:adenylate kinase family enzyme
MSKQKTPQWLTITGQSGAGKGTVVQQTIDLYTEQGIPFVHISNGDIFRSYSQNGSYIAKIMQELNNQSKLQPLAMSVSMWWSKIYDELNKNPDIHIIHEGVPRQPGEAILMAGLVNVGYIRSCKILEVYAPDEICRQRLEERTRRDKRTDLSIDEQPGTPDPAKINTKLIWWSHNRNRILSEVHEAGLQYACVDNPSDIDSLKQQVSSILF